MSQLQGWLVLGAMWIGLAHLLDGFSSWMAGVLAVVVMFLALLELVFPRDY